MANLRAEKIAQHSRAMSRKLNHVVTSYVKQGNDVRDRQERGSAAYMALYSELLLFTAELKTGGFDETAIASLTASVDEQVKNVLATGQAVPPAAPPATPSLVEEDGIGDHTPIPPRSEPEPEGG